MKLNFLQKLRDWFVEDILNRMTDLEQEASCLSNRVRGVEQGVSRLENELRDIKEEKTCRSLKKLEEFFKAWKNTVLAVSATATLVMAIFAWEQARSATAQAKLAEIVLRKQAFSRAKIGFYPRNDYCSFIFANSGINPIQDGKKAVLLVAFPSGEKPIREQPILWPVDLLDPDDPKSIPFRVPPPSGTNLFAFAVFHGTQEFLGEKRTIPKAKMMYRFGATWFEAPETFVTTGKCETEIIGSREQPILWEILQQFRSINENRGLNSP